MTSTNKRQDILIRATTNGDDAEVHPYAQKRINMPNCQVPLTITYRVDAQQGECLDAVTSSRSDILWAQGQQIADVLQARANGCTWAQIGDALGITKQSAQARFSVYER